MSQPKRAAADAHLDPRAPLVLDIHELGRRPGAMRKMTLTAPAPPGFRLELAGVDEKSELDIWVRLEAVMEGVLASGEVTARVTGQCGRCLDPLETDVVAAFQQLYSYDDRDADEETLSLDGDLLDLEPTLRDAIVLALPMTPLCREDCAGLCAECGIRLDDEPGHRHDMSDPRWAALASLLPDQPGGGRAADEEE